MKRYFRIFFSLVRNNIARDMEYRANFVFWLILEMAWVGIFIITISVLYQYTDEIMGWSRGEMYVLVAMYKIIKSIFDAFIYYNLRQFPESIAQGDLDYYLTKPVNTLFLVSFRRHFIMDLSQFLLGLLFLVYALRVINYNPDFFTVLMGIFSAVLGLLAVYLFTLFGVIFAIFTTRLTAVSSYNDIIKYIIRYPTDIFSGRGFVLDVFVVFLSALITIPAKVILGQNVVTLVAVQALVVIPSAFLVYRFWKFALRSYSSASS